MRRAENTDTVVVPDRYAAHKLRPIVTDLRGPREYAGHDSVLR